jgi:hypothetical protein
MIVGEGHRWVTTDEIRAAEEKRNPQWKRDMERGRVTPALHALFVSDQLPYWEDPLSAGAFRYNVLGWAIQCQSRIVRDIVRLCSPQHLEYPCVLGIYSDDRPMQFALMHRHAASVTALLEHGVPARFSMFSTYSPQDVYMEMCLGEVRARKMALFLILARKRGLCLMEMPRDVVGLIARAVYATRGDDEWI